jgi:NitT/TauT family transport system permease protein
MMSWAGGWFFLMAAEIFTVGQRDFRLPGLGAYLHQASSKGDFTAIAWGLGTLIIIIVLLDQVIWRPLIAWSDRFKVEMVENDNPPTSWFYDMIHLSRPGKWIRQKVLYPIGLKLDELLHSRKKESNTSFPIKHLSIWVGRFIKYGFFALLLYGSVKSILILANLGLNDWNSIGLGVFQTALRMVIVLILALAWTIPVGVLIGTNTKVAAFLQPVIQITASVPATALFPVMLIFFLQIPGGLNLAAIVFMLMGTQWYLLFNVIAGAMSIPQDLKYTASMMRLGRLEKWKTLILPALFPYLITGAITASGGAWNASIVAEYVTFRGEIYQAAGIGSIIASSTAEGNYPLLFAATSSMILAVVLINRLVWRPLYRLAEESYRME